MFTATEFSVLPFIVVSCVLKRDQALLGIFSEKSQCSQHDHVLSRVLGHEYYRSLMTSILTFSDPFGNGRH